jgi:hypothetical protein
MIMNQSNADCGPLGCDNAQPWRVEHILEDHTASILKAEGCRGEINPTES